MGVKRGGRGKHEAERNLSARLFESATIYIVLSVLVGGGDGGVVDGCVCVRASVCRSVLTAG